ncbi:uncharacterized protein CXorf66 homolog [Fukomys damarensis]|uniref:uncharacterized protein CXorf66 homolog n=1 Tax=Fukomys damarensis TaxID=885580 RepID=UPI00053FE4BF|nr:uncharacterized protein CXorf66 homolog [Fukomys damarensis]XP_010622221.1 uncharacterized protein CXorf66 homolog [Fukomys damarensis]XP_010622222.1 uncharacterized protein CXorf66 homolog [Fukomys damarensis]
MNECFCVLLLSVWTTNCLNTSTSNGSFTTGVKTLDDIKEEKLEDDTKNLLKALIVVIVIISVLPPMCFCLTHHNCMIEPVENIENAR